MGAKVSITFIILMVFGKTYSQLIITEIMFDPTPTINLPNTEYIEVYNISDDTLFLDGWTIADVVSEKSFPQDTIPPQSFALVADEDDLHLFSDSIKKIGIQKLPSLNNTGDDLYIKNSAGSIVDQLSYTKKWHTDNNKDDGGYSLEKLVLNHCHEKQDWATSASTLGGTPGLPNSHIPKSSSNTTILSATYISDTIYISFTKNLSPTYQLYTHSILIDNHKPDTFLINHKTLTIPFQKGHTIEFTNFLSCDLTRIDSVLEIFSLQTPNAGDIVINEILFDPDKDGVEFIELYNSSSKAFSLNDLYLKSLDENGKTKTQTFLSNQHRIIYPGQFLVLCDNAETLKQKHNEIADIAILTLNLPPVTNSFGHFELYYENNLIDSALYYPDYHTRLYDITKGISLERINLPSNGLRSINWQSSSSASYSTPGKKNSQTTNSTSPEITLESTSFSPNGDNYKEQLEVKIKNGGGYAASLNIFDIHGLHIKEIAAFEILGQDNHLTWDGKNNNHTLCKPGLYLLTIELFHEEYKTKIHKKAIAIEY